MRKCKIHENFKVNVMLRVMHGAGCTRCRNLKLAIVRETVMQSEDSEFRFWRFDGCA